jgi:hypothetical protein
MLGGCGESGGEVGAGGFPWGDGGGAWLGLGIFVAFGGMRIESVVFFPTVVAGLNNQRGGEKLLFRSSGVTSENIPRSRGHLVDCLD